MRESLQRLQEKLQAEAASRSQWPEGVAGVNPPITPEMVRDALAKTRSKNLLDAPGWDPYFARWADGINQFIDLYHSKFGESPDPFALLDSAPAKGATLWELDTLRLSPEMKVAVWRILLGSKIKTVQLESDISTFSLKLVLIAFDAEEPYESHFSEDLRLIRHLGTIEVGNRTHFQGYYAFA
jgi:hypothetical protein